MGEVLVSAATGALGPVLGKLATLAGDEYKRLRGIRGEIGSLSRELAAMDAFLGKMSEAEPDDPQDKAWAKEVRELSYDVEDSIDDFTADGSAAKPDGFMGKIKGLLDRTKARHGISKAIEELKKQIVEVSQRNARYRSGEPAASVSNKSKVDRRALAIFEDASKLVGVDGPKEEVIQLLSTQQQQPLKLVAVVGGGGLGKTTLANRVYQELKGGLDCHAFLSVSQNPDIVRVMSNIFSQLEYSAPAEEDLPQLITKIKKYSGGMEDLPQIITKIRDFLANKRYFIVVDDIWKVETWDVIKYAFPITNSGSIIITTTRINVVAQSCCSSFSGHIYNMRPLDEVHSRQLFYGRLFNSEEKCPSHLKGISSEILEKCAGLPLAIIAISGLLADKASKGDTWEQVKDSIGRSLRNSRVDVMVNIISLSYMDLPRHLKTCLLYLSIFPEDHKIEKENMIRRWIGEGFIHEQVGYTLHESGETCFNELINRSLIQPADVDETFGIEVKSCRVHDMVLDFIVSKAVEENFVTVVGVPGVNPDPRNKVRRLSLQNDGEIPAGLVISNARSLHVFGSNAKIPPMSEFRLLRVLDFEDCSQLADDHLVGTSSLVHLKYLRLTHECFTGYNKVMEIPLTICQLQRSLCYVTLVLDGCTTVPGNVTAMAGLRVLEHLNVYTQSSEFAEGLGQLKNLRKLSIIFNIYEQMVEDWELAEENLPKMVSSISELGKANLKSLHISIIEASDQIFEESWFPDPPYFLRELVIEGASVSRVPTWMASLVNLEKLRIPMGSIREEDVEILRGLPSLRHLHIHVDDEEGLEMEGVMGRAMAAHPNRPALVWTCED